MDNAPPARKPLCHVMTAGRMRRELTNAGGVESGESAKELSLHETHMLAGRSGVRPFPNPFAVHTKERQQ